MDDNTSKEIRNLFRLKLWLYYSSVKDIKNLFKIQKESEAIKDTIIGDISNFLSVYKKIIVNQ